MATFTIALRRETGVFSAAVMQTGLVNKTQSHTRYFQNLILQIFPRKIKQNPFCKEPMMVFFHNPKARHRTSNFIL